MIEKTIIDTIEKFGTDCVLTEYETGNKRIVRGFLQPINSSLKQYTPTEYTEAGTVDNDSYLFLFNVSKESINYENAMLWVYDSCYWIKDCKVCRFVNKPLYMRGVLSPYKKE